MSKSVYICCSNCGRDLYKSFTDKSEKVIHMDFYVLDCKDRIEHLCPKCYASEGVRSLYELKDEYD